MTEPAFTPGELQPAELEPPPPQPEELTIVDEVHHHTPEQVRELARAMRRRTGRPPQCMSDNRLPDGRLPDGRRIITRALRHGELALLAAIDARQEEAGGQPVPLEPAERELPGSRTIALLVMRGLVTHDDELVGITPGGDRALQRRRG